MLNWNWNPRNRILKLPFIAQMYRMLWIRKRHSAENGNGIIIWKQPSGRSKIKFLALQLSVHKVQYISSWLHFPVLFIVRESALFVQFFLTLSLSRRLMCNPYVRTQFQLLLVISVSVCDSCTLHFWLQPTGFKGINSKWLLLYVHVSALKKMCYFYL